MKCFLFQKEVHYLYNIVNKAGVWTDPKKVAAVKDWPVTTNVKRLQIFLGLSSYYCRVAKSFTTSAAPLQLLSKKVYKFRWQGKPRKPLKTQEGLVLTYPDPSKPFILDCNAIDDWIGDVLSQKCADTERVMANFNMKLTPAEKDYCVTWEELQAVVEGLDFFHPYPYGASFIIHIDHVALQLKSLKNPEDQLAFWMSK